MYLLGMSGYEQKASVAISKGKADVSTSKQGGCRTKTYTTKVKKAGYL
jgi:hypothetical protein